MNLRRGEKAKDVDACCGCIQEEALDCISE
jgi:hypothetical protein